MLLSQDWRISNDPAKGGISNETKIIEKRAASLGLAFLCIVSFGDPKEMMTGGEIALKVGLWGRYIPYLNHSCCF